MSTIWKTLKPFLLIVKIQNSRNKPNYSFRPDQETVQSQAVGNKNKSLNFVFKKFNRVSPTQPNSGWRDIAIGPWPTPTPKPLVTPPPAPNRNF